MIQTKTSFKKGLTGESHPGWKGGVYKNDPVSYRKEYQKIYSRKLRISTIEALGGKCVKCGFSDIRALQIDHVDGGGSIERKERNYTGSFNKNVLRSLLLEEKKYQLLCANCNWIKRVENQELKLN